MKNTILAIAVLGTIAGAESAQSNATVYGLVDVGLLRETGGPGGAVTKLSSGIANGSRLGFRGTEDLGNGLSAFFDMQNGFGADTGAAGQGGLLFGRQIFVGLKGGFGTVKFGRQYSPVDELVGATDPFGNGYGGRLQNVFMKNYAGRIDNDLMYTTPTLNGFSANVALGLGEFSGTSTVAADSSANRYVGGSAGYAAGPLFVRVAHQFRSNLAGAAAANPYFGTMTSDRNTMLGATYNFGAVKVHAAFAATKTDNADTKLVKAADGMVGVSVPLGASVVMASYVRRNDKSSSNRDADQMAIGYNYALSKRTTLYASYAQIDNKNGVLVYTAGSSVELGTGNKAASAGIRHTF